MSWISYFILAYFSVAMQVGAARAVEWHNGRPDLVLIAAVFIALNAPRDSALLGCFILGAMHDLSGQGPPGLYAFSYGMVGLLILPIQRGLHRDHPVTHVLVTLFAGLVTWGIILVHQTIQPERAEVMPGGGGMAIHISSGAGLGTAVYSALLAPFVLWMLNRWRGFFHFHRLRRRIMATRRL
jgi:rod shape-determining protein MreD